eukprot:g27527.t1
MAVVGVFVVLVLLYYLTSSKVTAKATVLFATTASFGMLVMSMQNLGLIGMMTIDWPVDLKGIFSVCQFLLLDIDSYGFSCIAGSVAPIRYLLSALIFPVGVPTWSASRKDYLVAGVRFLVFRFRLDSWWFGVPLLVRGPLLSLPVVLATDYPPIQVIAIAMVMAGLLVLQMLFWPWKVPMLNLTDCTVTFCITLLVTTSSLHLKIVAARWLAALAIFDMNKVTMAVTLLATEVAPPAEDAVTYKFNPRINSSSFDPALTKSKKSLRSSRSSDVQANPVEELDNQPKTDVPLEVQEDNTNRSSRGQEIRTQRGGGLLVAAVLGTFAVPGSLTYQAPLGGGLTRTRLASHQESSSRKQQKGTIHNKDKLEGVYEEREEDRARWGTQEMEQEIGVGEILQ